MHPSLSALLLLTLCSELKAEKLNVLLIMADDLRDYGGVFTQQVVKTPNMDRLRSRGTTFERAYVQYTVCNPSRSSMMTGLRAEQTGITDNVTRLRQKHPNLTTLPQLCKEAGWQAHAFGKLYHLGGGKNQQLKDQWMDAGKSWHSAQAFAATPEGLKQHTGRNVTAGALKWCSWSMADGSDEDQPDGQNATATVAKIKELSVSKQPWFIGCGFHKPHDPFIAPKRYFDLYPLESLKLWKDPANLSPVKKHSIGFGFGNEFAKFSDTEWRELLRAYLACTTFMDAQLGRVLDVLDQNHLWDSTLVLFMSDHGYHTGERTWWNKNTLFERSCRAPLILAAPGMKGGQRSTSLVEFIDIYPTVVDFCGLTPPHPLPGLSLRPILEDPITTIKDSAFTLVTRSAELYGRSVRTSRWRFTSWSDGSNELYDHDTDAEETMDLSQKRPDVLNALSSKLQALPAYTK